MIIRCKHIALADFDATKIEDCIDEADLDYEDWKKDPYINKLDRFSRRKWVAWEDMVYTYFTAMKKIQGVHLACIIHKTPSPSGIFIDKEQDIIQNSPLQRNMFPVIALADFDATKIEDCIDEADLDYEDWKKDPYINKLDRFSRRKWVAWEDMVYTYFTAMKKIQGVHLACIIHKTPSPSGIFIDREQDIIQNSPLQRNMFPVTLRRPLQFSKS